MKYYLQTIKLEESGLIRTIGSLSKIYRHVAQDHLDLLHRKYVPYHFLYIKANITGGSFVSEARGAHAADLADVLKLA